MEQKVNPKILFTPPRGIGDLIHSLPLIHSLNDFFRKPEINIPVVDERQKKDSIELEKILGSIVNFSYKNIKRDFEERRKYLYRRGDFQNKYKKEMEKRRKFEKKIYDFYLDGENYDLAIVPKRFKIGSIFCNNQLSLDDIPSIKNLHMVDRNLQFAKKLGIPANNKFDLKIEDNYDIKNTSKRKLNFPEKYLVFVLSSGRKRKKWNLRGYKQINKFCHNRGYATVLVGSEKEYKESKELEKDGAINLISQKGNNIDLENFAKIAYNSKGVIGSDTGLIHIADATGTNVIGLYGPTRTSKFAPYNNKDLVISTNNYSKSMDGVDPKKVISNIEKILS